MNNIDKAYEQLNACRLVSKEKGDAGEQILLELAKKYKDTHECTIFWSYSYPYQTDVHNVVYTGNIKKDGDKFIELSKSGYNDEIDLVIVTQYRVFAIECKARAGKWKIYDHWAKQNGSDVDKSPVTQCEKHCRHLYHLIHEVLPKGSSEYIVPLTILVDRCEVRDSRSEKYKKYIHVGIADTFIPLLNRYNKPARYRLDIKKVTDFMTQNGGSRSVYK